MREFIFPIAAWGQEATGGYFGFWKHDSLAFLIQEINWKLKLISI